MGLGLIEGCVCCTTLHALAADHHGPCRVNVLCGWSLVGNMFGRMKLAKMCLDFNLLSFRPQVKHNLLRDHLNHTETLSIVLRKESSGPASAVKSSETAGLMVRLEGSLNGRVLMGGQVRTPFAWLADGR